MSDKKQIQLLSRYSKLQKFEFPIVVTILLAAIPGPFDEIIFILMAFTFFLLAKLARMYINRRKSFFNDLLERHIVANDELSDIARTTQSNLRLLLK